jgi:hypothetical protein
VGTTAVASSDDVDRIGAYAFQSPEGAMLLVLINKSTVTEQVDVTVAQAVTGSADSYAFSGSQPMGPAGSVTFSAGAASIALPARSATLLELEGATDRLFAEAFEWGDARAWSTATP